MGLLKAKVVLITGASSGIGKACAESFAAEGANLVLVARRFERLQVLAAHLQAAYKVNVSCVKLDVSKKDEVATALGNVLATQRIDILVNNAGLARGLARLQDGVLQHWDEMIDTNVRGLLYVTRAVLPSMLERNSGHIINIGSIAGHEIYAMGNVYLATKHAVRALSKSLRLDILGSKIRVSEIAPGAVETEFSEVRFDYDKERAKEVYRGFQPLVAQDIADAVLYCATRPEHVNIAEVVVYPTAQAGTMIHRDA